MVSSTPNSPGGAAAAAAARSRQDTGANLLQELEALSQALYKASQAQNVISGVPAGPSPRKEHHHHHHQQPPPSPLGLQRRDTMPARAMSDVFGKNPPDQSLGGTYQTPFRNTNQVRHSVSARPSAPLYEQQEQEELWKQQKYARHSIAAAPRPRPPLFGHPEEEPAPAAESQPRRGPERTLQPWHSQGFEKNLPEVTNFPEWLEDNINFSRKLEAAPEKKKSIWNWKPFRTLSHIGHTRYNCLFTVHVHAIEGLPQAMNGLRLTVHWRHKDRAVQTMPCRVFQNSAEFEETLQLRCSVYGSKSAHHAVKFMPKAFTLCVVALDVDELTLGEHRLDLSRLLPEAPEHEHEDDDKPLSWTTSFKLSGKAKGGTLVVTFGYELLHKERGDKSGRFGSAIGSPSMSSPSLRSFSGGGSHSTHGTPRPRPSDGNNFLSPTLSEPGDYHDYMTMEHLNLDESPHSETGSSSSFGGSRGVQSRHHHRSEQKAIGFPYGESKLKGLGYPQPVQQTLAPPTPKQIEEPAEPIKESTRARSAFAHDDTYRDLDEEDQEFVVVDQGVEVGTLPENLEYPESRYDDGKVDFEKLSSSKPATAGGLVRKFSLNRPADAAEEKDRVALPEFHSVEEIPGTTVVRSIGEQKQEVHEDEEERFEDAVEEIKPWDPLGRFQRIREEAGQEVKVLDPVGRRDHQEERQYEVEVKVLDPVGRRDHQEERQYEVENLQPSAWEHRYDEVENPQPSALEHRYDEVENPQPSALEHRYDEVENQQPLKLEERSEETVNEQPQEFREPLGRNLQDDNKRVEEEEEAVQETVIWETPASPPYPSSAQEDAIAKKDLQQADEEIWSSSVNADLQQSEEEMWRSSMNASAGQQQSTTEGGAGESQSHAMIEDLDDEVDLIAGDFLSMLEGGSDRGGLIGMSSDSENDSPRALLLKQFEQEAFLEGGVGLRLGTAEIPELNLDAMAEGRRVHHIDESGASGDHSDELTQSGEDEELASIMEAAESELQKATQTMRSKTRAKMLEDAETEALMQEWGLNERAFENSPPKPAPGFLDIMGNQMVKIPTEPPVLAQGVGPVVQTKDGGMLRSMTPALFSQSNASGKLVMQVSKPVVVPSEMGSSGLDIFRRLASGGVENMALQAMVAMPLEDISGKSVHQLAYESKAALEGPSYGQNYLPSNGYNTDLSIPETGRRSNIDTVRASKSKSRGVSRSASAGDPSDEFVNLEELAPMAMQKIEALAMDGLKIQADMTDESAPYSVDSLPWADAGSQQGSKFKNGRGVGSVEGVAAMHLLDARSFSDDVPVEAGGLMSKVISIDEWMRLDAGQYDENDAKDETLAILAAHGAVHEDVVSRGSKEDRIRYLQGAKASANFGKGGFMGNTLTIAVLVQLRDPLRNNEPVGAPMMALVQAERVIVPPRPKIPRRAPSLLGNSEVWADDEDSPVVPVPEPVPEEPPQPQFKITAVHVSGLKPTEEPSKEQSNKKKTWGNQKQQQSGSRWLAANGMGKTSATAGSKLSASKNKPQTSKNTTVKQGESLWSISSRVHGTGSKWKEVAALNPHIRNPDVIFANQKIRTR